MRDVTTKIKITAARRTNLLESYPPTIARTRKENHRNHRILSLGRNF